jgi:hypothetical protein
VALDGVGPSLGDKDRSDRMKYWETIAEIVSDHFPVIHPMSNVAPLSRTAWLSFILFAVRGRRRFAQTADRRQASMIAYLAILLLEKVEEALREALRPRLASIEPSTHSAEP